MRITTPRPIQHGTIGGFHKGPLQVLIHIAADRTKAHLAATRVLTRHQPAVTGQRLGAREARQRPDLRPDDDGQESAHPRQRLEPGRLGQGANTARICRSRSRSVAST